jgi:hypothetical protein
MQACCMHLFQLRMFGGCWCDMFREVEKKRIGINYRSQDVMPLGQISIHLLFNLFEYPVP